MKTTKMTTKKYLLKNVFTVAMLAVIFNSANAYTAESIFDKTVYGDFVVGPAKVEIISSSGSTVVKNILVTNRTGRDATFVISTEDFVGSEDSENTIVFLGESQSNRSLKNFISVPEKSFSIKHGEQVLIPVTVNIPVGAKSGGMFASLIVGMYPKNNFTDSLGVNSGAQIISRAAVLFFVNVAGDLKNEGLLEKISLEKNKKLFFSNSLTANLLFRNTGDSYLNPYGVISVKNIFGKEVKVVPLDPWYSLPNSLRSREVKLDIGGYFGKYTLVADVNRGYEDIVDQKEINFYVINPVAFIVLVVLLFVIVRLVRKFKKGNESN